MNTRTITLDLSRPTFAQELAALAGKTAQYTNWNGEVLTGTIVLRDPLGRLDPHFPEVHFPDGTWARLDHTIVLVDDEAGAVETAMGVEVHGTDANLVADYADASGRYRVHFIPATDDLPAYLVTSHGIDDAFALELHRAPAFDVVFDTDDMLTDRYGSHTDEEGRIVVLVDGEAYGAEWAEGVIVTAEFPLEVTA